jgi:hypothetical protein
LGRGILLGFWKLRLRLSREQRRRRRRERCGMVKLLKLRRNSVQLSAP